MPASRRLRYRLVGLFVVVVLFLYAGWNLYPIGLAVAESRRLGRPIPWSGFACSLTFSLGLGMGGVVGLREWVREARRRTAFELDDEALTIRDHDAAGKPRVRSWRRGLIVDVRPGPVPWTAPEGRGLGLHIRVSGKTILEVMPGHAPAVAQFVADRLNEALSARDGPPPAG